MNVGHILAHLRGGASAKRGRPSSIYHRASRATRPRGLAMEPLEDRQLLAVTSSVAAGILTVSANAADNVTISASGGNVLVNGANPGTGAATAASITAMNIAASGNFSNNINLSAVTPAAFTNIPATGGITISAGPGNDTVVGSGFGDLILGGGGNDDFTGGDGDDIFDLSGGTATVNPGNGTDTIRYIVTNPAGETVSLSATATERLEVTGGSGPDNITVSGGAQVFIVLGNGDNDTINASGITNATAQVTLNGGAGNDTITGGAAADLIVGGGGNDDFTGNDGDDIFDLSGGTAGVNPGNGTDTIRYIATNPAGETVSLSATATERLEVTGGSGPDNITVSGGAQVFIVNGNGGADTINASGITNPNAQVTLTGGDGNDTITGGAAGDSITGGIGNDSLLGGDGNDTLVDADGNDVLVGGAGDDVYRLTPGGTDTITDTAGIADRLEIAAAAMHTVTYNHTNATDGNVQLDPDGPGGAAAHVINYTGLDPILNFGTATNVIFNLPGTADVARLSDLVGTLRMESLNATFETTDFIPPAAGGSLTINLGGGADDLSIVAVATGATNIINGDADNDIFRIDATGLTVTLNGGAGTNDQVIGPAAPTTWTVNGAASGSIVSGPTFATVESLTGNASPDIFNVTAAWGGSLTGGGGNDQFNLATGSVAGTISGDAGNDTITGPNAANVWNINAANAGTLNGNAITGVETLVGGSGADDFNFSAAGSLAGSLDGGGGANELDFAGLATARSISLTATGTAVGFRGTEAAITGGFDNITRIVGSGQVDTLANSLVPAATATWEIDGTNRFLAASRVLEFAAIENLSGGSLADTFTVTAAHTGNLTGNGGNDVFNVTGVTVTGNLAGNADNDTFNFSGTSDVTGTIDGGAGGLDTMTLAGVATTVTHRFDNANDGQVDIDGRTLDYLGLDPIADNISAVNRVFTFAGATGDDITLGDDPTPLNGISRISSVSSSETVDFVNPTASLTVNSGTGADTVVVNAMDGFGGMPTVTVNGGAGDDDITINALPTGLGNVVNGDADNDEIRSGTPAVSFTANGGAGTDTLFGPNAAATWNVTAANGGNLTAPGATIPFSAVENLVGGSAADAFVLVAPGTLTGSIDGNGGTDTLTGANVANTWTVTALNAGTVTGVGAGFTNIENLVGASNTDSFTLVVPGTLTGSINGGLGTDTLTGANVANIWTINSANGGTATGVGGLFTNVENLVGGTSTDSFTLIAPGTLTGSINGGAGTDTLTAANVANTWTINAANAGTVTGLGTGFSNVENLNGGTNTDDFNFTAAGTISGIVNGGLGTAIDELNYTTYGSARNVVLTALGAADGFDGTEASIGGGFRNINTIRGTTGFVDSLTGLSTASVWNIAPVKTYVSTNTLTFADFETLSGGSATDVFNVAAANIESGEANTWNGNGDTDTFNITLPANGGLVAAGGTTVTINGGAQPVGQRDTVNVDATADTAARAVEIRFASAASGDVDILGIGTASATGVDVNTVEDVNYTGDAGNDDTVSIRGTAGDDDLTVRPLSASAADVFLGGVFTNSVPTGTPGIDGGSMGPDVSLAGMTPTGLTVNGFGGSNSLTVETPAAAQEINVTNTVVAPSMLVQTTYTNIGKTLNVVTGAGADMVMIDLPDVAGGAGAVTPGVDPNGPLPDFVRVLSDGGLDIVKYIDAGADQDHNIINFSDLDPAALGPVAPAETAFQLSSSECAVVMAGAGNDFVRNLTLFNNAGFSTNSVMDLGDGNDTAFGSNNGKKIFAVGEPPHGDVIYGGAGIDNLTAGTMGVKFLFADLDAMGVDHPMAGDVIDGSFNNQVAVSAGAGDFINNLIGGFFGSGAILNVVTWLKAQWRMGNGFIDAQASKCANWGANYAGLNLGSIASQALANLNSLAGDQWFDFTAAATGELTATALFAGGANVEVQIFDALFAPLAWNLSNDGSAVAQAPVTIGGHYFVRVRGTTTDVDLDLTIADPDAIAPVVMNMSLGQSGSAQAASAVFGGGVQQSSLSYATDQVQVTFSEDVQVSADDLSIAGINAPTYGILPGPAGFSYDSATHTATWTLATPITSDKIVLTLSDSIHDSHGNALDGEIGLASVQSFGQSATTLGSGDSVPGGSFELRLDVLTGDVDGDGMVTLIDAALVRDAMELDGDRADVNRDGVVNVADLMFVSQRMFQYTMLPSGEPGVITTLQGSPQASAAIVASAASEPQSEPATRTVRRRTDSGSSTTPNSELTATLRRRIVTQAVDTAVAEHEATTNELRTSRTLRRLRKI